MNNEELTFGQRLKMLRIAKGKTQAELAKHLGKTIAFYSAIEVGRKPIPLPLVDKLAEALELSEAEAKELYRHARKSVDEVRLNLREADEDVRDAALLFARRFPSLSQEKAQQLRRLLMED